MALKKPLPPGADAVSPSESARQIGFLIRKFYQKNQAIWQALCPDEAMTSVQSAALSVLLRDGPCTLTTLGRAAAMDPATTRGVVAPLPRRGLVSVIAAPAGRRHVIVELMPPGDYLGLMAEVMPQIAEATLTPLNPAERVALEYLLRKVTDGEPPTGSRP